MHYLVLFVLGSCISSFTYCFGVDWATHNISWSRRSHCTDCHHSLAAWQLLPFISWLFQRGRCSYCYQPIPIRYFIVELLGGVHVMTHYYFFSDLSFISLILTVATIQLMIVIDCHSLWVPDSLQLLLLVLSLLHIEISLWHLLTTCVIGGILFIIYYLHPQYIGGADIKLYILLSLIIPSTSFPTLLMASATSGLIYYFLRYRQCYEQQPIPFIPFIYIGFYSALFVQTI